MLNRWLAGLRRGLVEHAPGAGKNAAEPAPNPRQGRHHDDGYVSDFADYMNHFLDDHPEVIDDQRRGWAIWWNHPFNLNELEKSAKDTVPVGAYYYFDYTPPAPATPGGHGPGDDVPGGPAGKPH